MSGAPPQADFDEAARAHREHRFDDALRGYLAVLAEDPTDAVVLRELGQLYGERGEWGDAIAPLRLSLAYEPACATTWMLLGATLGYLADYDASGAAYSRAMQIAPDMPALRWNRALWLLVEGRWAEGWAEYQWGTIYAGARRLRTLRPEWDGAPLPPGSTLFCWAEQGLGDTLMFVRFIRAAQEQSGTARVVFECQRALVPFMVAQGWPQVEVIDRQLDGAMPGEWSEHISLMSLPRVLGVDDPDSLDGTPYLHAASRANSVAGEPVRVGLAWAGNPRHPNDRQRSMDPEVLVPLAAVEGVEWVSLQAGWPVPWGTGAFQPRDWCETAAVVKGLDLLITVDTAVAHLAGALGVPCWLLLPAGGDFRWLRHRADTPWYRSARLFRQEVLGEWRLVVERVVRELARLVAPRPDAIDDEGERGWSGAVPVKYSPEGAREFVSVGRGPMVEVDGSPYPFPVRG